MQRNVNLLMNSYHHPEYRRVCYAEVVFPDGRTAERQVLVFCKDGSVVDSYPLEKEEPFTEWRNERFVVTEDMLDE